MSRPKGREEIVAAVVAAATKLMAERGPSAVSLRDVADAADVTLSQIYRHVGNKDALLAAVLAAEVAGDDRTRPADLDLNTFLERLFRLRGGSQRTQLQARVILDGYDLAAFQSRFPGIDIALDLLREQMPEEEARVRAAAFASFFAGWQLLGPGYLRVTGAAPVSAERLAELFEPLIAALAEAR